mgnify:CR=1 FL=1
MKILDLGCGTGTELVACIKKLLENGHNVDDIIMDHLECMVTIPTTSNKFEALYLHSTPNNEEEYLTAVFELLTKLPKLWKIQILHITTKYKLSITKIYTYTLHFVFTLLPSSKRTYRTYQTRYALYVSKDQKKPLTVKAAFDNLIAGTIPTSTVYKFLEQMGLVNYNLRTIESARSALLHICRLRNYEYPDKQMLQKTMSSLLRIIATKAGHSISLTNKQLQSFYTFILREEKLEPSFYYLLMYITIFLLRIEEGLSLLRSNCAIIVHEETMGNPVLAYTTYIVTGKTLTEMDDAQRVSIPERKGKFSFW